MTKTDDAQQHFFSLIKEKLPTHFSLVDELADLLKMSNDSAYRRIRGEKMLTLDEIKILSCHYGISIDSLFNNSMESVTFNYQAIDATGYTFEHYLNSILSGLQSYDQLENVHLVYVAKDIPIFHNFIDIELASFKMYFWLKTVVNLPDYDNKLFDVSDINTEVIELGKKVIACYNKIPSIEVWTDETVHSLINQLEYCWESGLFKNQQDAALICEQITSMLQHIQKQAELGYKYLLNEKPTGTPGNFQLYYSEVMISNNSILAYTGSAKTAYLSHNTLNFMATNNVSFCEDTDKWIKNVLRKSTLISGVSEKKRHQFFKKAYDKIAILKKAIG
jgi:hypothetical protein